MIIDTDMGTGYSLERTRILLKWIGTGKVVLDLGCYDGRDSEKILKQGNKVYGVEVLDKPAEIARRRGIILTIFDLHKEDWPFEENFFDVVVAGELIEHIQDADSFLFNIYRILKPSGVLIVSTPNIASIGRRLLLLTGRSPYIEISKHTEINGFPAVGHVRYFTLKSLTRILNYHNFEVLEATADILNIGFFSSSFLAKLFPTFAWRLLLRAEKRPPQP